MKKLWKAFWMSFSMFCAIPTPFSHVWEESVRSLMLVMFPFVGAIIGGIWALGGILLTRIGCPLFLKAALLTLLPYWLTGGIHLDGYMDCCDAIFSRRPLEKRREILKDSHVGSFAVTHLAMLFLIGFAAFASCEGEKNYAVLILICMASRAASAIGVSTLRPMNHSEYAGNFQEGIQKGNVIALFVILLLSMGLGFWLFGWNGFLPVFAAVLGYAVFTGIAFKDLDGFSGDVTGFGHTLGELCGILVFALL